MDYFDPDYFNTHLSARKRAHYAANGIAMPLPVHCSNFNIWKNLSEKEFMDRFGNAVKALYNIPTQEELEQLEDYDAEDEEQEE